MKRWIFILFFIGTMAFAQAPDLGVMLGNVGGSPQKRIEIAKQLGASWFRPEAVLLGATEPKCEDCEAAHAAGMKLVLVVRNAASTGKSSAPVSDAAVFQAKARSVLERYKPEIVVVENEPEDQKTSFSGTAEEYAIEVKAICEMAHALNLKCTDGGLSSPDMAGVVIDEVWKSDQLQAGDFGIKTEIVRAKGTGHSVNVLGRSVGNNRDEELAIQKATADYLDKHRAEIDRARAFLLAGASGGTDLANFHWYELRPEEISTVLDVLGRLNKRPPMTDEVGQREERAFETGQNIKLLREAGVNPIIWNGLDGKDIVGLVNKNGSLGTNGRAFQSAAQTKP
jgi:hypothetical protein